MLAVVGTHLGVVTALWWAAGGAADLTQGGGATVVSVARLAGLWASALLLVQLLGMARVPLVERAFGLDRVTQWHRWSGLTSMWLIVVHVVLVWWGYALLEGRALVVEAWVVSVTMPGMLLAVVGTTMLVMVGVTSFRIARRKLRYESWHLVHLYGYLGAGLVLPHQLWTGTSFATRGWAVVYWWSVYAIALTSVLVYRVGAPVVLNLRLRLRVASVIPDGTGLVTAAIVGDRTDRLRAEAGQFFTFRFVTGPGWTRGHPLSLSAAPSTAGLQITMNVTGDDGPRIAAMPPGTRVLVEGPYGRVSSSGRRARHILGLAAGAGIAPIVALLEDNALVGGDTLIYRYSTPDSAALNRQTEELTARAGLTYIGLPGPRSGTGTAWLPRQYAHLPGPQAIRDVTGGDVEGYDVVVCGPPAWSRAVLDDVRAAGVPARNIHVESYSW